MECRRRQEEDRPVPETLFRFVPAGRTVWTLDEYRTGDGVVPECIGGTPGCFPLSGEPFADYFYGPEHFALTPEQRAWFRYVYEGGPRPAEGA